MSNTLRQKYPGLVMKFLFCTKSDFRPKKSKKLKFQKRAQTLSTSSCWVVGSISSLAKKSGSKILYSGYSAFFVFNKYQVLKMTLKVVYELLLRSYEHLRSAENLGSKLLCFGDRYNIYAWNS